MPTIKNAGMPIDEVHSILGSGRPRILIEFVSCLKEATTTKQVMMGWAGEVSKKRIVLYRQRETDGKGGYEFAEDFDIPLGAILCLQRLVSVGNDPAGERQC